MNITGIKIENIKGIKSLDLNLTLYPNKPNILVAPNGFGKSSLAVAFASMHSTKIVLEAENYHLNDGDLVPRIQIHTSGGKHLEANNQSNSITNDFSVFVINNPLEPKANSRSYLGRIVSNPTIEIKPTVLVHTIPVKKKFTYRFSAYRRAFGSNGKILTDISSILSNGVVMTEIASLDLSRIRTLKWKDKVDAIILDVNRKKGSANEILEFVDTSVTEVLGVGPYQPFSEILIKHGIVTTDDKAKIFTYIWQLWQLYMEMGSDFKKACRYSQYLQDKDTYARELEDINPVKDRIKIVPREDKNQLIVKWPKAHELSNGQRDILVFYAKLLEFERIKSDKPQILIIDEIFDYLDDINILLFQYKISSLIDSYRKSKRIIFPILVTHLDPNFFHHFCFNEEKINVCYLKTHDAKCTKDILRIISERESPSIKKELDEAFFHHHPDLYRYDLTDQFKTLGLNNDWGNPIKFRKKIFRLLRTYLFEDKPYDPVATCWAVRLMIEEVIYSKISKPEQQKVFLQTKKTKEKLRFASRMGVPIPDAYFLLGLIYNVSLHNSNSDIVQSTALKLNSLIVKDLIKQIAKEHYQLFGPK